MNQVKAPNTTTPLSLASFNVHGGVDGWGRPFDVVEECAALDADILVMQESWTPTVDGLSTAATVASVLGYDVIEEELATGRLYGPHPSADDRWGPGLGHSHQTFRFDGDRRRGGAGDPEHRTFAAGRWGLAVLTRVPVRDQRLISLGQLHRDPSCRVAIACTVSLEGRPLTVFGTHMSHLLQGSPVQYLRLRASLPATSTAAVLAGDMNLWGPPLTACFPGWRQAVRGRTWPSYRPHSQVDHVLATSSVSVIDARIAARSGSDHLAVRVLLALSPPSTT